MLGVGDDRGVGGDAEALEQGLEFGHRRHQALDAVALGEELLLPTFAQLGDPAGPGINPNVDAQSSTNYELGAKGLVGTRLRYGVSVFHIDIEDQLVPFELNDDVFYRNAGESSRNGIELSLDYQFTPSLSTTVAFTVSDFEFEEFTVAGVSLDGNDNPGIPENQLFAELSYVRPDGWYAFADLLHVGSSYADDLNTAPAHVDAYQVANVRFGRDLAVAGTPVSAFVGINNVLDEEYFSNVRINQTGNRYFEPAPGRHFYGGFAVTF
jgi:iron complex outermembrane receptor protein